MALSRGSSILLCLGAAISCTAIPPKAGTANAEEVAEQAETTAKATSIAAAPSAPAKPAIAVRRDFWFSADPQQGGLVIGRVPTGTTAVRLDDQNLVISKDGFFLMGFNRDAQSSAELSWTANGAEQSKNLQVKPGKWKIERVNVNYRGGARSSAEFKRRRGLELAQIVDARKQRNESGGWRQDFLWPVKGRLSGFFGSQRVYRGKPGSYHSGMDIAVPRGTPFVAPADGVVILAAKSPFTLEGYLLMIDHGMGLNSAFLHCSQILVEKGEVVKQGQIIGKVGSTGRATGPHLHWGMKWNAARVDPLLLLQR